MTDPGVAPHPYGGSGTTWPCQGVRWTGFTASPCTYYADARNGVLQFLHVGDCGPLRVTGCWANVNPPGASHRMHAHPNNFLSGVYYVSVPAGADTINFHDPRPQTGQIRPPVTALTAENTDQVVVRIAEGTLLLFPAWLMHSVDANPTQERRVSVSFNLMFDSPTLARPLWGEQ